MSERRRSRQGRQRNRDEGYHHESGNEMMDIDDSANEESNRQVANAENNNRELDPFQSFMEATDAVDASGNFRQRTRSVSSTDLMLMGEETMHALEMEAGEEIALATKLLNEAHEQATARAAETQQQATSSSSVSIPQGQQTVVSRGDDCNARNDRNRDDLEHRSHSITTTPLDPHPQRQIQENRSKKVQEKTRAVPESRSSNCSRSRKNRDPLSYLPYTITVTRLDPEPPGRQSSSTNPGQQQTASSQNPQYFERSPVMPSQALQSTNQGIGTLRHHQRVPPVQASPLAHPHYPYIPPILQRPPPPFYVPAMLLKPPFDPPNHLMPIDQQWKMYHHLQLKQLDSQFYQELYQNEKELYERHQKLRKEMLRQQQQEKQQESQKLLEQGNSNHEQRDDSNPASSMPVDSSQMHQEGPNDDPGEQDQMEEKNQKEGNLQNKNNDED